MVKKCFFCEYDRGLLACRMNQCLSCRDFDNFQVKKKMSPKMRYEYTQFNRERMRNKMVSLCEKCVTDRSLCDRCRDNPKYRDYPSQTLFAEYIPVCPKGYGDCVYDPAYIKFHYPEWYKQEYGDMTLEEAVTVGCCAPECGYDTEDK